MTLQELARKCLETPPFLVALAFVKRHTGSGYVLRASWRSGDGLDVIEGGWWPVADGVETSFKAATSAADALAGDPLACLALATGAP